MSEKLENVQTWVEIQEGRVTMRGQDSADLYVEGVDHTPLSTSEPHAKLGIVGEGFDADMDLDGEQLDALCDALYHIQQEVNNE